jgi:predicted nucleic acid-binding Zn ribbon protein
MKVHCPVCNDTIEVDSSTTAGEMVHCGQMRKEVEEEPEPPTAQDQV